VASIEVELEFGELAPGIKSAYRFMNAGHGRLHMTHDAETSRRAPLRLLQPGGLGAEYAVLSEWL
jgi:hypothetical protein